MSVKGALELKIREMARRKGLAYRTEQSYVGWYKRYVKFHQLKHPTVVGQAGVEAFLNHLAVNRNVAGATQNQAFSALLFLYREVLREPFEALKTQRAKREKRLPVVLSKDELRRVFGEARVGEPSLLLRLLYGCGLRVSEGLKLRIKDVDFANQCIWVRHGKGGKDRCVALPQSLIKELEIQVQRARILFQQDVATYGRSWVSIPESLERKSGGGLD